MIPRADITSWRRHAPWSTDSQVEHDLVLSRALVEIFLRLPDPSPLAFRGGTALHKLYLHPPARYSEDLDFVQTSPGPMGPILETIRAALDPWLRKPKWKVKDRGTTLLYTYPSEDDPSIPLRLKIEINSREHRTVWGLVASPVTVSSRWFLGSTTVTTYSLEELLGTKLRALYQRRKGRDLFDLWRGMREPDVSLDKLRQAFLAYVEHQGLHISRSDFERNLREKQGDPDFGQDIRPLLAGGVIWDEEDAWKRVGVDLVGGLP